MAGRTLRINHKGTSALVKEGHDNKCIIEYDGQAVETEKKFPAACREALTRILETGGRMKGNYNRE